MTITKLLKTGKYGDWHIVVPSMPGTGFTDPPPITRDYRIEEVAHIMDELMRGLGFGETGYVVQGGDWGTWTAREMAAG